MADPSLATTAERFSSFVDLQILRDAQLRDWAAGTPTGGPNADGFYPLTNSLGEVTSIPCVALIAQLVAGSAVPDALLVIEGLTADAQAAKALAEAAAATVEASNATALILISAERAAAEAARDAAANSAAAAAADAASIPALEAQVSALQAEVGVLTNSKANLEAFDSLVLRVIALETAGGGSPIIYPGLDFRDERNSMYI